ncbi:MAG: phosphate signaling complex protein PhoU [Oligoflexia bacterium]|nr:phosphate signaling complex protein PhoU [Oligoflexia bacterium]MBF0364936.1 phosphate signaling complex protein PhoU [Oligoflexia bacterium]
MDLTTAKLREEIINMATLAEKILSLCLLENPDFENAVSLENQINKYHTIVDDLCFKFIALKRPMAKELRLALSIIKINTDLERIGDLAFNIIRSKKRLQSPCSLLAQIASESQLMLRDAIDSFSQADINLASDVIRHDQIVNELNKHIIQTYTSCNFKQEGSEINFDHAYNIVLIANKFERVGDHSTNIAEDVIFLESGRDVRHQVAKEKEKEQGAH